MTPAAEDLTAEDLISESADGLEGVLVENAGELDERAGLLGAETARSGRNRAQNPDEDEPAVPVARTCGVVAPTVIATGVVIGMLFDGLPGKVLPSVAGLAGVLVAAQAARRKGTLAANATIVFGVLVIGLIVLMTSGAANIFHITSLLREAKGARHVLRPPADFLPGFRAIVGWLLGGVGFAAGWVAIELRRPSVGLLVPLPIIIVGAISIPKAAKLPIGVVVLVLFIVGLALLSSLTQARQGDAPSFGYELRRVARAVPLVAGLIVVIVLLARTNLLFPPPIYDPVRDAQRPKAVPLSQVEDKVLFEVRSKSTGPWRLGLLDVYDGREWRIPAFAETALERVRKTGVVDADLSPATRADFLVKGLSGAVLPGMPGTVGIVARGPKLAFDPRTGTIRLAEGQVHTGLSYTVTGAALPTEEQLKHVDARLPKGLDRFAKMPAAPPAVQKLLDEAPTSSKWERLDFVRRRLLETVTAAGPGIPVAVPPSKVEDMLAGSKEASPFEIVAAQAMLARWAGVPARIGYGFDGGQLLSENVREVRPKHGSSWLEVYFPGFKWFPVLGAPLKAKPSLSSDGPTNDNPNVVASDQIAAQVFIPMRADQRSLFFDQVRRIVLLLLPLLTIVGLVWLLYPLVVKLVARSRRRAWAARQGPVARIEVAYAEFRDWCTDLGLTHESATPIGFLDSFVDDEEHTELAWLVTRALYGDLRDELGEEDAFAAEELSRALRRRVSASQPLTIRAIAWLSRLSLRRPYFAFVLRSENLGKAAVIVLVLGMAMMSTGCTAVKGVVLVKDPAARVNMKAYPVDFAFGDEPDAGAPPAALAPFPPPLADGGSTFFDFPTQDQSPPPTYPPAVYGPVAADLCPEPGPNAVAEEPISADVKRPVEAGSYLFKQQGTLDIVGIGKVPLPPLTARIVRNVQQTTTTAPQIDFDVELFTGLRRQIQKFRAIPGDGIYLRGISTKTGNDSHDFNPVLPVLVFKLPATQLTAVSGVGVDPLTGETLVVQGTIDKVVRVEGCGEVVDAWHTNATWTFQRGTDSQVYQFEYSVATQHGGLIVQEHLQTTDRIGPLTVTIDETASIGSIHPKPVAN